MIRSRARRSSPRTAVVGATRWRLPARSGNVGPNLDQAKPSQAKVRLYVQNGSTSGGISMPAFASMSQTDLNNVAAFVYASTH